MLYWIVLLSIVTITVAKDCGYPNGTVNAVHYFNCDNSHAMHVKKITILDDHGNNMYPVNFRKPFTLKISYSYSGQSINKYTIDVDVSEYKTALFSSTCKWHGVPTLGLTDNLDGCQYMCPIPAGDNDLNINLDLSAEGNMISSFVGKNDIQMKVHVKDSNKKELACVYAQFRAAV